ncbi:ANAPC5 domain-containing protein [Trichostrongylus colubriformis]|uniref:Anaphase-promoting complex subunit 5 n=1 Tax=Trichostrongylus colubriformis TaxID=6319 RepID=A0AAN8F4M6_TRICO
MLCHIRAMNLSRAAESLRIYFDYSMFRASDSIMATGNRGCRLGVLDQRSLRFSCLLQARLCRIFGDKQAARLLLSECVQQAQNHDMVCLRMAMVELAALDAMPPNDLDLKALTEEKSTDTLLTTDELLRMINRVADTETRIDGADDHRDAVTSTDESEQLFEQLNALAHLMTAITAARRCKSPRVVEEGLERAMRCTSGPDSGARARLISDAAVATTSSVRLRHGFALATQSLATSLVETNYSDGCAPRHETEAHAIAGVNMVYAAAMMGEWDRVTTMLGRLKLYYTQELNWQAAHYVNLCDRIILFDTTILRGQWDKCVPVLEDIETLDAGEAALRRAILLAAQNELSSARNLLESIYSKYETPTTVFLHMRLRLQLAMLLSAECRWSAAVEMLQGVHEEALGVGQRNIAAMALRRIGVVQMMSGDHEMAIEKLDECRKDIRSSCSVLENAILSIAFAVAHSHTGSKNERLRFLNKARAQCRQAGAVLFEKFVLQEIALCYHECGDMDERDDIASEFAAIDDRYAGHFDWKLV